MTISNSSANPCGLRTRFAPKNRKTSRRPFFTKEKKKIYKGPDGDPTTSLTLPELCHHVFNNAETGGVDTCPYAPDNNGNVWCMTKHYTRVTYEEAKVYIDHCLAPEPAKVFDNLCVETPASILA